jgi:hypothetical protein
VRVAAVSVDLDEIPCYAAIHGLTPDGETAHAIYRKALPRLRRLLDEEGVPCTFFAIGRDVPVDGNAERLRALLGDGHELANHSLDHFYDLTRRDPATIRAQIRGGMDAIEEGTGVRPAGFRAPGYTITDGVFEALAEEGVGWDSSVFPCPGYWAAKAAAIGLIRARGRRSHSIVDDPRVLSAPADPYRVGRPYHRRGEGLLELPVAVTRDLTGRLPYIGTALALSGETGARLLTRMVVGRPLVCLELHGIDLADATEDGLSALAPHQPDLRRSAAQKGSAIRAAIAVLRAAGYGFETMSEAARRFG